MSTPTRGPALTFAAAVRVFEGDAGPVVVTREKLDAFLNVTAHLDSTAADRLRQLAIELEYRTFADGWAGLRSIYATAADLEPANPRVLHSWGISAMHCAEDDRRSADERRSLSEEAERQFLAALRMLPRESRIAHSLGVLHYSHPWTHERSEENRVRALGWFEQAVAWDATNAIAHLYIAHCYHDVSDWPRAIAAYERVDLDRLSRDWPAWRAVKCREQLAACYAAAGDLDEARGRIVAWLDEVESWDEVALEENVINVHELVDTLTNLLPDEALRERTRNLIRRMGHETAYVAFLA